MKARPVLVHRSETAGETLRHPTAGSRLIKDAAKPGEAAALREGDT